MGSEREAAVVKAAQGGDQRAQDELVTAYLPLVYNIVGRALSGHADVDDVVQETLIRALGGLGSLRDPASFRSWLVAIIMNQIRDRWQARRADQAGSELAEARELADPGADFVDLTIVRLGLSGQRREVAEATRWLDADDRALLSLWWLEAAGELTRAEVAAAMELSPQHTAVRVQRMKAQLETARVVVRALSAVPRCVLLDDGLAVWNGVPSALWRKRLARHARDCTVCSGYGAELVPAERLLVGLGLIPASAALAGAVMSGEPEALGLAAHGDAPVQLAPAGRRQERRDRRSRRRRAVAASAAVLLVGGGGYAGWTTLKPGEASETTRSRAAADAAVPPVAASTPPASPTTSAPSSPSAAPRASASPAKKRAKATPRPTPSKPSPKTSSKAAPRPAVPKPRPTVQSGTSPSSFNQQVTDLVNTERAENGCGPVRQNSRLNTAAQRHSADMAARDFFDHTNPDGAGPGERITAAGYTWSTYGENIALGQRTPAQVMESWMNSSGHRANILNCSFKEIGIGIHDASGGPWWTQVFGASR
ncbi:sigma-70 family RNA polymerase sigma factor [Streptomyces sp. ISL-100]|uniref:sigma-70 family RNA polymerase sigma factor n=1 Tax=Streptomyces sp. ISL-100 TaxID=2819173 RepID=UPI001BE8EE13|nr:sigma-70 family RNA polymerase sigma factor [Streptomyces sp. ISL-100]MBT2394870.1 sigma-70 family RNA polymerase sigma factor [Streptomyces sp. ISL-100]